MVRHPSPDRSASQMAEGVLAAQWARASVVVEKTVE